MLRTRIIPVLNIMNGLIVRSENFSLHQIIGNVVNEASRYSDWQVDELIYLDISRESSYDMRRDDHKIPYYSSLSEIIHLISKVCFMPLTFGGGIRSLADIDFRIRSGADKVTLNTGAFHDPDLIRQGARKYGAQCIVVSIDYKIIDGMPSVFTKHGFHNTGVSIYDWIREAERLGAGEIFLKSIERDGAGDGFDIETIGTAVEKSHIPIIACGGAGDPSDFKDLIKQTKVSALAAGNIFHFTENAYPRLKKYLKKEECNVR